MMTTSRALAAGAAVLFVLASAAVQGREPARRAADVPKPLGSVIDPGVITTS